MASFHLTLGLHFLCGLFLYFINAMKYDFAMMVRFIMCVFGWLIHEMMSTPNLINIQWLTNTVKKCCASPNHYWNGLKWNKINCYIINHINDVLIWWTLQNKRPTKRSIEWIQFRKCWFCQRRTGSWWKWWWRRRGWKFVSDTLWTIL